MNSLCQWFCACRCIGKRNKDFLNAAKAPLCKNTMACKGNRVLTTQPSEGVNLQLTPTALYSCDICGQDGLNENDMKSHVLIAHVEGAVSCPFCDLEGTTAEEMTLHVNSQHLDYSTTKLDDYDDDIKKVVNESSGVIPTKDEDNKECKMIIDTASAVDSPGKQEKPSSPMANKEKVIPQSDKSKPVNAESVQSYMPLQEIRNASEISMDTTCTSSVQSNISSATSSPESDISICTSNRASSSGNNNTSCFETSSESTSTTPEEIAFDRTDSIVHPREIKINVIKDSPKKILSDVRDRTKPSSPLESEDQSRKRAKLYLNVPQPHTPHNSLIKHNGSLGPGDHSLLDSHASTTELHKFGQKHGRFARTKLRFIADMESDGLDDTSPEDECDMFTCPLCSWNTRSPGAIVRHVNTDHLDVISPSTHQKQDKAPTSSSTIVHPVSVVTGSTTDKENNLLAAEAGTSSPQFTCPLCNLDTKTGSSLELHVNSEHAELLSPAKPHQQVCIFDLALVII